MHFEKYNLNSRLRPRFHIFFVTKLMFFLPLSFDTVFHLKAVEKKADVKGSALE